MRSRRRRRRTRVARHRPDGRRRARCRGLRACGRGAGPTLVAALALLSLASFEAVALLRPRRGSSPRCSRPDDAFSSSPIASRRCSDPADPAPPPAPRRARARKRERPLRGRGATGARARRSAPRARAEDGSGGAERGGEDDGRATCFSAFSTRSRSRDARRPGPARAPPGGRAARDRRRRPGRVSLLDEHP